MKVKLIELRAIHDSVSKLMNKELPVITAYKLGKFIKVTGDDLVALEEVRIKLVRKYGKKNEDDKNPQGSTVSVPQDKQQDFFNEYNEVMQEEVEINFEPIPVEDLGDVSFTPLDMMRMDSIIKDNDNLCSKANKKETIEKKEKLKKKVIKVDAKVKK